MLLAKSTTVPGTSSRIKKKAGRSVDRSACFRMRACAEWLRIKAIHFLADQGVVNAIWLILRESSVMNWAFTATKSPTAKSARVSVSPDKPVSLAPGQT
jgi:hypothetical protein